METVITVYHNVHIQAQYWTKYTGTQAEGNHPLSERALKIHNLQTSYECHQFRCPKCFYWWWKHVPKHKPVCKCYRCWLCLNPLKLEEQFGVGCFVCSCRNIFYRKCQASDSRKCDVCGCRVSKPYIRQYFRIDDAKRIPVTPEQQHQFNPNYAATNHGYYIYTPNCFPHPGPTVNATSYDMPQPSRRNTFGDFILPQIFAQNSQQFATRNPPRPANPATMCPPPHATRGFAPLYPSGATSLQSSKTNIRPALCAANNHTAALAIRPPTAIGHPLPYSPQGGPQFPQSPVSASPAPACCSTTPAQTTMAVSLRGVPPVLDYTPLKDQVIPSSGPQSVNECNHSPQIPTTTSVALPVASGSASVLGETTAIPSLTPATENSLQCNPQPPSMTLTTSGPLPVFPTAISSDPDPLRSDLSLHSQPQLNGSSASKTFPTPLSDELADLHISGTPCAPQGHIPETGSTPIQSQGLLQSDGPPMAALISPAPPGSTGINPPLPSAATTQSTPSESDANTGQLVKVSGHVSSEKPPPDHHSGNVDYNPSVTTAIPPSYDPMTLSESQRNLAAPNHCDSSQAGSGTDDMSLAAITKSDLSLPETSAPTISTAESSNTVTTSAALVDANTQTEVKTSTLDSTLSPSQGLPTDTSPPTPSLSSIPQPPVEATTTSTPQAIAIRFESKAVQTAALPSVNVVNNIMVAVGNPVVGSMAKPARHPLHQVQNDQWTSYYDSRVPIPKNRHMNPRDLKYKQVSTLHDCSGSTEYSTDFSAGPQLSDPRWKHHQMRHPANRNQHYYDSDHIIDMDYDMLEISSDEED